MRIVTPEQLKAELGDIAAMDDPRVVATGNFAVPRELLGLVDGVLPTYRLYMLNAMPPLPDRDGVTYESSFVGPGMRRSPRLRYYPSRLSLVPRFFAGQLPPDLVVLHVSRVRDGKVSLGIEVNIMPDAIESARKRGAKVIAQINTRMPYTLGDAEVSVDDIDFAIEHDQELLEHKPGAEDENARLIGEQIAHRVPDGATLQTGIGAVPDAVMASLSHRRNLNVWTELMSDGTLTLEKAGAMDPQRTITCSFLFGSRELYDWVDCNPRVQLLRTTTTNDPGLISKQPIMTSVNTALQVDLFVQANASRINHQIYSGTGGQTDFIVGAMHSPGGHAYLALNSWHPKANVSTIVPKIPEATTSLQMSAVVTEQGLADLYARTQEDQARELIVKAAHPDARDELRTAAVEMGLLHASEA